MAFDTGKRADQISVVAVAFAVGVMAVTFLSQPGASPVVWPLALAISPLLTAAAVAGLVAVVASSIAARRGYPRWSGAGGLGVFCVLLCTGCMGLERFVSMGSFSPGGTRVGSVMWRQAHVPMDSYTVPALYRCDSYGILCARCPDRKGGPVWGDAAVPEGETCPEPAP